MVYYPKEDIREVIKDQLEDTAELRRQDALVYDLPRADAVVVAPKDDCQNFEEYLAGGLIVVEAPPRPSMNWEHLKILGLYTEGELPWDAVLSECWNLCGEDR